VGIYTWGVTNPPDYCTAGFNNTFVGGTGGASGVGGVSIGNPGGEGGAGVVMDCSVN